MGPKIYRDYDHDELNRQYEHRSYIPNAEDYIARMPVESARVRAAFKHLAGIGYGPTKDEMLDIFPVDRAHAPVLVFIHGGQWRRLSKEDASYIAESFVPRNVAYVAVNFSLAPTVSLDEIVRQNRAAIAWVYRNAESFGADRDRLFVMGHSSGGHITGTMLSTDWEAVYGLPADVIKGATAVSGMYDLEPVRLTFRNEFLKLDEAAARRLSPIRHLPRRGCPLIVGWGGSETDEFRRQSREYAEAWRAAGFAATAIECAKRNHFETGEDLNDPKGELLAAVYRQIGP